MATTTVSSIPPRPLSKADVLDMDGAREYCIDPDAEIAYAIILLGREQVHALGYDSDAEAWVQVETELRENDDDQHAAAFEATLAKWVEAEYGDRLGDDGDLKMVPLGDPDDADAESERDVPREVEMGLEPEYDCPDCEYYKTGLTTGPHAFLDHLETEHGYSRGEAFEILNG